MCVVNTTQLDRSRKYRMETQALTNHFGLFLNFGRTNATRVKNKPATRQSLRCMSKFACFSGNAISFSWGTTYGELNGFINVCFSDSESLRYLTCQLVTVAL